jgi:MFS family permease
MPHVLRSLRHRNFRLFYLGQLVSLSGTWMQNLAQAWLLYRLTGSAFMLGLASAATLLPSLVLGVYGGALADRFSRRNLLMTAQALAMVQAVALAGLTLSGAVQSWQVLVLALLLGVVQALELPARHSFVAQLVPPADLANAVALNSSLFHAARLIGPAIAGLLVAWIGEGWVFLVNAGTFIAVLVSLRAIRLPPPAASVEGDRVPGLWAGLAHVRAHPPVRAALAMVATVALLGSSAAVLLPVFAVEVFATGAERLGLLMGAIGVGALVGALLLAGRRDLVGLESVIAVAGVAVGVTLVLFAVTPLFGLAMAWLAIVGLCTTSVMASSNAFIQLATPDRLRGRVMALFSVALHGMLPLGSLAVGALAEVLGAVWTVGLCGALLAVMAFVVGGPLRRVLPPSGS